MTIHLVDDDPRVRKAIGRLLKLEGFNVAAFAGPSEFLAAVESCTFGCLILDVAMPGMTGLQLQELLLKRGCSLPIIFLTGRADVPMCAQAMKRGALDFLTKPVKDVDLLDAVQRAMSRQQEEMQLSDERQEVRDRLATLTPRELEVLEHVVSGKPNKQIASLLGTAEKTVKVHRGRVMEKLSVDSVAELVALVAQVDRRASDSSAKITRRKSATNVPFIGAHFVTVYLGDAVPKPKRNQWRKEAALWLEHSPLPHGVEQATEYERRCLEPIEAWLDTGHGSAFLKREECAKVVTETMREHHGERYHLFGSVVRPNHLHALLSPAPPWTLDQVLHTWTSTTANQINKLVGNMGGLWHREYLDRVVREEAQFERYLLRIQQH